MSDIWSLASAVVGGLVGAGLSGWLHYRFAHIQTLRLAWADWTASVLEAIDAAFEAQKMRDGLAEMMGELRLTTEFETAQARAAATHSRLQREHERLALLEAETCWLEAAESVYQEAFRDPLYPERFAQIFIYVRNSLVPKNRQRLRTVWLEGEAPRALPKASTTAASG
jgi:hypothetical protein